MYIPEEPLSILTALKNAGFEACAVGGCVRDSLRGTEPHDWDICTSALPEETEAVFSDEKVIETGMKHGTVTVILNHHPYEITTFRSDGLYTDHRRPDSVTFVRSLPEDLARRDFTINAMACRPDGTIIDLFGGQDDLANGIIRCVGDPETRFTEDALRILRALRFAAVLDFQIDSATSAAARKLAHLLACVSAERIYAELDKLLVGPGAGRILTDYPDILGVVIPEILPCVGFDQHNPCHYQDVWTHTITAFSASKPDRLVRWALLLHDLGKPESYYSDPAGIGHFTGHPLISERIADEILHRLRMDKDSRIRVCRLVKFHDARPPETKKGLLRWQEEFGLEDLRRLYEIRRCDGGAHTRHPKMVPVLAATEQFRRDLDALEASPLPCRVSELAVHGADLMALGVPSGPALGKCLNRLLEAVQDESCPNDRDSLLRYFAEHWEIF